MRSRGCEKRVAARNFVLLTGFLLFAAGGTLLSGADGDIALLVSDHTYAYFQNAYEPFACNPGDWNLGRLEYERYYKGWMKVLEDSGMDFTVIGDADVTPSTLQRYGILILSNAFWLDDYQTKVIAEWVRRGGRLLATFGAGYAGVSGDFFKGGTNGLHQLWGDPSGKVNSSFYMGNPWVKIRISNGDGPSQGLEPGTVLDYQYMANVLIQRPESSRDINAFFVFDGVPTRRPAVFNNRHSKGLVVYYAFAPEYLISLAYDTAGHCANDTRYPDSPALTVYKMLAEGLHPLMKSTLEYLRSH